MGMNETPPDEGIIVVLCTAPDAEVAAGLAKGLVEERIAACVNVLPALRSFYVWEGRPQDDAEAQLLIKTRATRFDELAAWIAKHHPYEVPEIIATRVSHGYEPYLRWIQAQT